VLVVLALALQGWVRNLNDVELDGHRNRAIHEFWAEIKRCLFRRWPEPLSQRRGKIFTKFDLDEPSLIPLGSSLARVGVT
jgi:hypothetical protein